MAKYFKTGTPVHTANIVKTWKRNSLNLNPIENCRAVIKKKLQQHVLEIESEIDLKTRIRVLWQSLSISYIKQLYLSMPRRIRQGEFDKFRFLKDTTQNINNCFLL